MMNKKCLVLGASHSQIDFIVKAKEMGLEVFTCGGKEGEVGFELADDYRVFNILDKEKVKEYAEEKEVDFMFTMGMEKSLPIVEGVSEDLNLPHFFSTDILQKIQNKGYWRELLGDIDGNLSMCTGSSIEDFQNWTAYPSVLKPIDGSGQRGVYFVEDFEDVKKYFDKSLESSASKTLILEEFAGGEEISVNSYMYQGKLAFAIVSDRISYDEYPGGIIKEHHIPSKFSSNKETEERIITLVENVNKKIGFENGHIYFQIKIDKGEPKLIEFTPRFDGCHMWNLIKFSTGLDLRQVVIEHLTEGKSETLESFPETAIDGVYKTKFISAPPKTLVDRSEYVVPEDPLFLYWYYEDGEIVKKVTGYMEKIGYYIVKED